MTITAELCEFLAMSPSQAMLERKPDWVNGNISKFDQPLLIGLTRLLKPKKVIEIGVASGWSGCLFIDALEKNPNGAEYIGIDLSPKYYLDHTRNTGSAIAELFPNTHVSNRLLLGKYAVDCLSEIGKGVDLAFIDGDHRHPWAMLDLLSILPILSPSSYVLIHDLNLSTYSRHNQTNRGPKYLFECWPFKKIHSSQNLPMIGAVQLPASIDDNFLSQLLNTTYTPWETSIETSLLDKILHSIDFHYGEEWCSKFQEAFQRMNSAKEINAGNYDLVTQLIKVATENPHSSAHLGMLQSAMFVYPKSAILHHHISILKYKNDEIEDALKYSLLAVELAKSNAHFISFLGEVYFRANNLEKAIQYLSEAITLQDNVAIFHYRLARAFESLGRTDEAVISAQTAFHLSPDNPTFADYFRLLTN